MGFELRDRVQARATLFDEGTEDAQGRKYSEVQTLTLTLNLNPNPEP